MSLPQSRRVRDDATQPARARKRTLRPKPRFWVLLGTMAGALGLATWWVSRPGPVLMSAPTLTAAEREAVLKAIAPGWPAAKPTFAGPLGAIPVTEGRIDAVAALAVDGAPEWGVAYTFLGPKDAAGARAIQPGFAVVTAAEAPEVLYRAPGLGGWGGAAEAAYTDASGASATVEAVPLDADGYGFFVRSDSEMNVGGRQSAGRARLYMRHLGDWTLAFDGETDQRWSAGATEETSRSAEVALEDVDGDGHVDILATPSWYERHLEPNGRGPHFSASGLGRWVYRLSSGRYGLSGLLEPSGRERRIRAAAPVLAVRAEGPITVDGRFDDWTPTELARVSGLRLDDPALLKYKRRDRHGVEDFSGELGLVWDETALYVRALVTDDTLAPGPSGRELYQGDHLAVWLDWDLEGDFRTDARTADDWQIGLKPGGPGTAPEAYCWVPKAGAQGVRVASTPLVDSYSGGVNGYRLEAAVPWASLGGLPPGMRVGPKAGPETPAGQARRYTLGVAGAVGFAAVLTDTDTRPQELVYVSNPGFTWAAPRSFNTLMLVEPRRK